MCTLSLLPAQTGYRYSAFATGWDIVYNWFNVLKENKHNIIGYITMPHHVHALIAFSDTGKSINTIVSNGKRFMAYALVERLKHQKQLLILQQSQQTLN